MTLAIETEGLVKRFGATSAVDGVDLEVRQGTVYSVLGPNGAGKSTIMRILSTLLRPDAGSARVFGHDVVREADAARRAIGLTGQATSIDEDLTGMENLILIGRLVGYRTGEARKRAGQLLEVFELADAAGRLVKTYSGGEQRRLDVAASLVVTPELLFLDEPTTGIDPRSRNDVWEIIRKIVAAGSTVLLTTQYLDEADALADRIALMDHGKVVAEGTPADLKSSIGFGTLRIGVHDPARRDEAEKIMTRALGVDLHEESDPARLSAPAVDPDRAAEAVAELCRAGIGLSDFALAQPSLDEVFLTLTGDRGDGHATGAGHTAGEDRAASEERTAAGDAGRAASDER